MEPGAVSVEQAIASARAEADESEHWVWSPVEPTSPGAAILDWEIVEPAKEAQKTDETTSSAGA